MFVSLLIGIEEFIGESYKYEVEKIYKCIIEMLKNKGIAGVTVLRKITGVGKINPIHTTSILRL